MGGTVISLNYNVADQVTSSGNCGVTHDSAGNQTGGCNNCSNTYTAANQPSSVGCGSGSPATVTYPEDTTDSPSSVKGSCQDSSSQTGLDSIGCNASGACSNPGTILTPGVDPDHPLSIEQNCQVYDIIYDCNGQPTGLADSSGNLVGTCSYDEITHAQSCTGPFSTLPIGMDGNLQPISGQVIINGVMCDLTTDVCDNGEAMQPGTGSVGLLPPGLAPMDNCIDYESAATTDGPMICGGGAGDPNTGDPSPPDPLTEQVALYADLWDTPVWKEYGAGWTEVDLKPVEYEVENPAKAEQLRRAQPEGRWWKMMWDGRVRAKRASIHFFENDTTHQAAFPTLEWHWSNEWLRHHGP